MKVLYSIILVVSLLFIMGCASTLKVHYDDLGRVEKIVGRGAQDSAIEQGDIKVRMNTSIEPLKDIVNIQVLKQ